MRRFWIAGMIAVGICAWGTRQAAWGAELTLARDGRPTATIVLPADAPERAQAAARDLQHYIEAICGVQLPIRTDGRAVKGTGLYIGHCQLTRDSDLPKAGMNPESYSIVVRDGSVFFTGRHPTPTYFAVASFIEEDLGVRWFVPGALWEYVPQGTKGELRVDVKSRVSVPAVSPRVWSGHAWFPDWKEWDLRNKVVESEVVPRRNFQNNMYRVLPPSQYARTHPEYYPLVNGKRWIPKEDDERYWWPCISNPDVLKLTVAYANHFFDTHPDVDSFSLGMDDIRYMCGCDQCRAMDAGPEDYARRAFSDRFYKFVNEVARQVRRTHPDRYIGTLIYDIAHTPPKTVKTLEPNVFGFLTERCFQWWQPGRKEADHAISRRWAGMCRHLSRYDYYGMGTFTPRFAPHAMAEQMKFDGALGLEGMYVEAYTFLPDTAPMMWALAKMQWDRSRDVDALLEEFYKDMYGSAAPTMKRYFDLLEKSWNEPRPGRTMRWVHRNLLAQVQAMSVPELDQAGALLDQALEQTRDAKARRRIEINQAGLRYGGYAIRTYALAQRIAATPVTDRTSADQVLALSNQLAQLSAERKAFWAQAHQRKDLLGETLRGLGDQMHYLQTGEVDQLELPAAAGVVEAMDWYNRNDPQQAPARLAQLKARGTPFMELLEAQQWVATHHPGNLLQNGDFEQAGGPTTRPKESDWTTQGTPAGWSFWARMGSAQRGVAGGEGMDGSHAAFLKEVDGATYIQLLPVKAGERYLVVVYAKAAPQAGGLVLHVRFHTADGAWYPKRELESLVQRTIAPGAWQPVILLVHVPEGAAGMQVMPGASGLKGTTLYFDNAAVYRVGE